MVVVAMVVVETQSWTVPGPFQGQKLIVLKISFFCVSQVPVLIDGNDDLFEGAIGEIYCLVFDIP